MFGKTYACRINFDSFYLEDFLPEHINTSYVGWLNSNQLMKYSNQQFYDHNTESCFEYLSKLKKIEKIIGV